jgi:hypothetical protein
MTALSNTAAIEARRLTDNLVDSFEKYNRDGQLDHVFYHILKALRRFNLQAHWVGNRVGGGWQLKMQHKEPLKNETPKQELISVLDLMTRLRETRPKR